MLPLICFHEPPTALSLSAARAALEEALKNASSLAERINTAEVSLAQIVKEAQAAIEDMLREKEGLEDTIEQTQVSFFGVFGVSLTNNVFPPCLRRTCPRLGDCQGNC